MWMEKKGRVAAAAAAWIARIGRLAPRVALQKWSGGAQYITRVKKRVYAQTVAVRAIVMVRLHVQLVSKDTRLITRFVVVRCSLPEPWLLFLYHRFTYRRFTYRRFTYRRFLEQLLFL
jgi:hypothetical protein